MGHISETLAKNMKKLRSARGWTQEELAKRSGLSHGTIRKLETAVIWVGVESIRDIASAFQVPEEELFLDPDLVVKPSLKEAIEVVTDALKDLKKL